MQFLLSRSENPIEVAKANGWPIEESWGEAPKWLYMLFWEEHGLLKIGLTKPLLRNRSNSVLSRARKLCLEHQLPFECKIFSTGGTLTHEARLRSLLHKWKIEDRKDWFILKKGAHQIFMDIQTLFDEHI